MKIIIMKAIQINNEIKVYSKLPKTWKNHLNFDKASVELQQQEGFYDVVQPVIDPELHRLGEIYWDKTKQVFTYPVIDIPQTELNASKQQQLAAKDEEFDISTVKRLLRTLVQTILEKTVVTKQDIADLSTLYLQYREGTSYSKGDRFNYDGGFYEVTKDFIAGKTLDMKNVVDMYLKYVK